MKMTPPKRWTDQDLVVRVLRVISVLSMLALFSLIVIDPARRDFPLEALLVGAILIQLLYDFLLKVPEITIGQGSRADKDEASGPTKGDRADG